ncbi:MAG: 4'-phosphopantetheinyl transferase superfamily protein [Bacteroidota bacterium]|nr:4'-phosphopantetheinyl transferase superfamily protein [Bacteroidota bacterium]
MIKLFYIENTEPLAFDHTKAMADLLGEKEQLKYLSYRRWQDRQAYLLGKLLVIKALNEHGLSAALIKTLQYTSYNRPFISEAGFDFNISHSGSLVVCAISDYQIVGIDIELIQKIDLDNFSYILNEADVADIQSSNDKYSAFFKIWSAKEAVLKADGCGLTDHLHELQLVQDTGLLLKKIFYIRELDIANGYSSCIASSTPLPYISIEKVVIDSFVKIINK